MTCSLTDFSFSGNSQNPSIADISIIGETATLNTANVLQITSDVTNYIQTSLLPYIDCYINSIGSKLSNGDYDVLVNATRDKITTEINDFDLDNFDNIKTQFNTKLNNGDYNNLIDNVTSKLVSSSQIQIDSPSFTTMLNTLKSKILSNIIITPKIYSSMMIGIGIVSLIILLLIAIYFKKINKN